MPGSPRRTGRSSSCAGKRRPPLDRGNGAIKLSCAQIGIRAFYAGYSRACESKRLPERNHIRGEAELNAGLYALGAMEGEERRPFEAELARDPALRAEMERWQTQLAALEPASLEQSPDPGSWSAIAHRLGFSAEGARTVYQGRKI